MPKTTSRKSKTGRGRAGQKGGRTTAARYGRKFYQEIGRLGGRK